MHFTCQKLAKTCKNKMTRNKDTEFKMTSKIYLTNSTEETEAIGFEFAKSLAAGDFVAMFGDLGVGKTAFIRGAVSYLAPNARVQSPTYTIVNEYPGKIPVYHFDMYRIDKEDSLYATGYYDYTSDVSICFAEWSEKIIPWLPKNYISITIEKAGTDMDSRRITIDRFIRKGSTDQT